MSRLVASVSDDAAFADVLVRDAHGDASLGADKLNEVDNFSLISLRITIGEGIRNVVGFDTFFGGENEGSLGVIVCLNHAVRTHYFDSLIVAILSIAVEIDGGGDAGRELEHQNNSVIVVHLFNLLEPSLSRSIDLDRILTNQPAVHINIMRAAVVEDSTKIIIIMIW